MKKYILLFASVVLLAFVYQPMETEIDSAFQNSKRGIYWSLANLKKTKIKLENKLVQDDKLYAAVKLTKEINGVRVESTGFHNGAEVTIVVFRSFDSLTKEGYIDKGSDFKIEEFEEK